MSWQDDPVIQTSSWQDDPVVESSISKPESFLRGAANNFPMAPQAISALEPGKYSENLSDWNQKAQLAKQANPKTYGVGAVGGALAPLAIPGVGEALEAAPIAGNAVLGGLNALSNEDLTKNLPENLKKAAVGAGIGGATAGVLKGLLPGEEGLEKFANKKAIQSVEMPSGIVGAMEPEERTALGSFIQDNNLVGRDKAQILEHARDLSKQFGQKIGEIGDKAGGLQVDRPDLEKGVQSLIEKGQGFEGFENKEAQSLAKDYKAGANDVWNKVFDSPDWNTIQKLKEQYGKLAFDAKGEVKSEGAKDTYFVLKDMLTGIAKKAQGSNLAPEYKTALANYSQMQPIESGLEKAVDSELRGTGSGIGVRGLAGLVKKLPGPVRAVAGPAAVAMGHPIVGLAAALPELTDAALQSKAASGLASLAKRSPLPPGQSINQLLNDYLVNHFKGQ